VQGSEGSIIGYPERYSAGLRVYLSMRGMGFHGRMLDYRNKVAFFQYEIRFAKALFDIASSKLKVFTDIGHIRRSDDKFHFSVAGKVFMDWYGSRFASLLRVHIGRQIFVLYFDEFYRSLSQVLVLRRDCRYRLADVTDLVLSKKGFVPDRFPMDPSGILSCDDCVDTGELFGLFDIDPLDLRVGLWTEEDLPVKHVREDKVVAINGLSRNFLLCINPGDRLADVSERRGLIAERHILSSILYRFLGTPEFSRRVLNGLNYLNVAGTATKVA
jgi:hypothetical protein